MRESRNPRIARESGAADGSMSLLDRYFADLRQRPVLTPERTGELAREMREQEAVFRAAIVRTPGVAELVMERWAERQAQGRVTGLMAHEARGDTDTDWTAFIDERLSVVSRLIEQRGAKSGSGRKSLDATISDTLSSANLLFELLESIALELRSLHDMRSGESVRSRRAALGITQRGVPASLRDAEAALEQRGEARRTLAAHNLRLVVGVAKRFVGQGVALADLIQEGNVGLLRAVEKFDPDLGYRFSTYAVWWIEQAMIRAIQRDSRTVRVPSHMYEARLKQRNAWEIAGTRSANPSPDEVADAIGVSAELVEQTQLAFAHHESLDTPMGDEDAIPLGDRLAEPDPVDPDAGLDGHRIGAVLSAELEHLPDRERQILEMRFGLRDGEELTLQEIGNRLGISRERVRQIQLDALASLGERPSVAALREAATPGQVWN